ncbi:MAG TPA: rhomboid family intramembrane serine protease [Dongiaceae bacterium]|nr:rhomboid family intramembrane serine protease [Dongiaceae bacterium]
MPLPYQWQMRVQRWKSLFSGMFGSGERRPQLCPSCGALVGINANRCHQCGANLRFGLAAWSKGLSEFFGGHAPVTTVLLIINVIMFAAELMGTMHAGKMGGLSILWSMDGETLYRLGASNIAASVFNQWYRLVTAMFLHGGLIHIGFNMMVLLDIGPVVEELYGSSRYLFIYVLTGAAGFALSMWFHPAVGASGALMGLIGILIAVSGKRGSIEARALRSRLISWAVSVFLLGFFIGADNVAHFGGLATGFVLGKVMTDRQPVNASERNRAYALGWLAGLVTLASFIFMFLHYRDRIPWAN